MFSLQYVRPGAGFKPVFPIFGKVRSSQWQLARTLSLIEVVFELCVCLKRLK